MSGPAGPLWFDPAPPGYPWSVLMVPTHITTRVEAEMVVELIKEAGNASMRGGDHYDALWKYNHALVLCRDHKLAGQRVSVISSNCAQACINLKYYHDAFSHATDAISADPHSLILHKAFYRRAEASRLHHQDLLKRDDLLAVPPSQAVLQDMIQDYWYCFRLKDTNTKAVCEAIILTVDNSVPVPMVFLDRDVECRATTRILTEMLERQDSKHAHLNFLLHKIPFRTADPRHFDCSSIQFSAVCKKSLGKRLLATLCSYGMSISPKDVVRAVELLPDTKSATLDVIAANCKGQPPEALSLAYVAAEKLKKAQLLECLKKHGAQPPVPPEEKVSKFKEEGNEHYRSGEYDEALARYYKALALCQQHRLEEEEAVVRGNCAQACLLLELFRDAYDHANECLRLDPESSKGYYRRAEALRKMLESPKWSSRVPTGRSFADVVEDYFHCHRKTENVKAIYQALVVATNHECTKSLPRLTAEEMTSGLATKILMELVQREDSEQKHFSALLFSLLPEGTEGGVDVSSLRVADLLEGKSITSAKLIQRLISLGMKVNESDVASAVQVLKEHHRKVLQLLLKGCLKTRKSTFTSACQEALKAKKLQFVSCLIENGGTPDVEDLKDLTGWPRANTKVDPAIDAYLQNNSRSRKKKAPEKEEPPSELPDPATALISAKEARAYGEVLLQAGQPLLADQKFQEALAVCAVYNFQEEMSEVYFIRASLHLQLGLYETAFTFCTNSLHDRPTAKMHFLRATVLQKALSAPAVRVPRSVPPGTVVTDYCQSHRLQDNVKALTEAIIFAVDNRLSLLLKDRKQEPLMNRKHVKSGFCTDLLLSLLKHEKTKEPHMKVLLEIPIHRASPPLFDGSRVSVSMLIKKKITHSKILNSLFDCGMSVGEGDLRLAVETLVGENGTATLEILCSRVQGDVPLDRVCRVAMKSKKVRFVLCLVRKRCSLPCSSQEVLALALEKNLAEVAESLLPFCTLPEVDLGQLMSTCGGLVNHVQLVVKMIDGGVNPGGLGTNAPMAEVLKMTNVAKKVDLVCVLLRKGCHCDQLCAASECPTTPIHVAVSLGVEAGGSTRVLDTVVESKTFSFEAYDQFVDGNGNTPLHLAVNSVKKEHGIKLVKALIETHRIPIDPLIRDKHGKRVADFISSKKDNRLPFLFMAASRVQQAAKSTKRKKRQKNGEKKAEPAQQEDAPVNDSSAHSEEPGSESKEVVEVQNVPAPKPVKRQNSYDIMSVTEKLELHLKAVLGKGDEYFITVTEHQVEVVREVENGETSKETEIEFSKDSAPSEQAESVRAAKESVSPEPLAVCDGENGMSTVMSKYGLEDFDGLPWEVEVTNNVLKFFKNEKEHPYSLRLRAARTVYQLAEGKRGKELSKELSRQSSSLFEAKMSRGGRIIWQRAIQFSPRRTGEHRNPIYAQVIRIWEIVPDHDQLSQTIRLTVKQIELSNERGLKASLNVPLIPQRELKRKQQSVRHQERLEIPKIFTQADVVVSGSDMERFTPAASPKEDEFNVTTFYSFSGAVLKSMLTGSNTRRDFPFKEWPKEHEIINLPDTESILLLGRSGTGKTTCCLYRLWNEFKLYWDRPTVVQLPRKPLMALKLPVVGDDDEVEDEGGNSYDEDSSETAEENVATPSVSNQALFEASAPEEETKECKESEAEEEEVDEDEYSGDESAECDSEEDIDDGTADATNKTEEIEEHLHQVFVTKNYVLCAQMKRRFYDMAAAHDFLHSHMDQELRDTPHSFAEIDDFAYPLFLTARQFYVLLDNSIGGDAECFFRPRERDGGLRVKIVSSDYDHEDPDTLLDLEDSDNEGEEIHQTPSDHPVPFSTARHPNQQKYLEVTSLYFAEKIWPEISRRCGGARRLDPLLVWIEIQSFIKGSRAALLKGSALLLDEYRQIGNKMAPNFSNERETIYDLYRRYEEHCQNKRHSVFLFDECDLVHDLHCRLRKVRDLPWSIHSLYIDEVQDFTQAELALYLHCCRHPNSLFFTGDTAQSIMRGIAFRFQDLRSSFHAIHEAVPQVKVPQQPHTLTINFRSHSGILRLAGSIIDLLQMFFKGSIDHLPADQGMFPGPMPVVLASCEEGDLALLLSSNRRESSRIEFGAHQVVLVQSKEAKERLPTILKGAIVLTIFESKGLEFDDVLLYNFFYDSMVDEKGWRVVTAYLEEHGDCIKVDQRLPGSGSEPRSNKFDEKHHKALNSELKYLYTAITRAKCNLWIYDADQKKRLPMFDLWYKRGLVKVVGDGLAGAESQDSLIFASISTQPQWRVQGDYFMRRSRWEQAKHCYDRAGPENECLSIEANARFVVQQAAKLGKPQLYLEAAVDFLRRDQVVHSVQCLLFAAQCLRRAKPQRFSSAAVLFERLGKYGEALKCYRKIKDTKNCVRLLERESRYDEAVRMFRAPKEALAKAVEYTSRGIQLSQELLPDNLSYVYASQCAKRKDKVMLVEMLRYMSDPSRRARFLKICGLHSEALKEYVSNDELDEAYRLASGQCMFSEGRQIAKNHEDSRKEAKFVFHQVHSELLKSREKCTPFPSKLQTDLQNLKKAGDPMTKAHTCLLLGLVTKDVGLCRNAHGTFLRLNKAAALEAFDALTSLVRDRKPVTDQVLTACATARELERALETMSDLNQLVKQATGFYGLQKVRDVYLTPPNHNVWVSAKLKSQCQMRHEEEKDIDGLLRLDAAATKNTLAAHVGSFVTKWLDAYGTESLTLKKLMSFTLHSDIQKKRYLLRLYTESEMPAQSLTEYMGALVDHCRLGLVLGNQKTSSAAVSTLLAIFSPEVSIHLPLTEKHMESVRKRAGSIRKCFHDAIKVNLDCDYLNRMDKWFSVWRACSISDGTTALVDTALEKLEEKVNYQFKNKSSASPSKNVGYWRKDGRFQAPYAYQHWKLENKYYHVFGFWLHSCTLVKENKPIWAAKHAIYHFLGTITQRKSLSISVMNLVNVLIVHCTALFAMLTQLNHQQNRRSAKFVVPTSYPACVKLFDLLNCCKKDHGLLSVCTAEVKRTLNKDRQSQDCRNLLDAALNILLGRYRQDSSLPQEEQRNFRVLRFAFRNDKVVGSGAAHHCLVLALTIFANLTPYLPQHKWEAARREFVSFFNEISGQENLPHPVKEGRGVFQSSSPQMLQSNVLQYVGQLLSKCCTKGTPTQAFMMVSDKGKTSFAPLPSGPITRVAPTPQLQSAPKVTIRRPSAFDSTRQELPVQTSVSHPATQPLPDQKKQPQPRTTTLPARPPEGYLQSHPVLATTEPPSAHPVQPSQDSLSVSTVLPQPPRRKWGNLPPVLDGLLQLPSTTSLEREQQSRQTTGNSSPYQMTHQHPLSLQPTGVHQSMYNATLPQPTIMSEFSVPGSQVFDQPVQQQLPGPVAPPFLQPQLPAWSYNSPLPRPYDPTLAAGPTHQHVAGGPSGELPWPDFPMYRPQTVMEGALPGAYYPPFMPQQPFDPSGGLPPQQPFDPSGGLPPQQSFDPSGALPPQQSFDPSGALPPQQPFDPSGALPVEMSYSSTIPSHIDWDPFAGDYVQQPAETAIYYGNQYQQSSVSSSPYNALSSEAPALPLHVELATQLAKDTGTPSMPPPANSSYAPQLRNSGVPLLPPTTGEIPRWEKETAVDSRQLGQVPLSAVYDSIVQPPSTTQSPSPTPTGVSQPTTAFEEVAPLQKDVQTEAGNETDSLLGFGGSGVHEHVSAGEQEEGEDISGKQELPETEGTLEDKEVFEEMDEEEEEEEEKAPGMSAFRRSVRPHLLPVDPHLVDPSIVTEEFCNICGVGLRSEHAAEVSQETGEEVGDLVGDKEVYESHVQSTNHAQNYTLHKNFQEKLDESYTVMVEELRALVHKCEHTQAPSLTRVTDDMHEALDKYERKMADRQANLSWRQGLILIEKATDDFQRLLSKGNREYEKFKSENPRLIVDPEPRGTGEGDSDTEFHAEMNKTVDEMDDDFTLKPRSEAAKLESRTRKKNKKRKK